MKLKRKGFTLVELIIVIAIIAVLAGAIFVAIDPARRLHETRNARRSSDITTILDAVKKYQADNAGDHYLTVDGMLIGSHYIVGTDPIGCAMLCSGQSTQGACVDLSGMGANYLAVVPKDPKGGTDEITYYMISKDASGAITIKACSAEGEGAGGSGTPPTISITR